MQNNNSKFKNTIQERSFQFSLNIIKFIDTLNKNDNTSAIIGKQLLRSATSIGANVIEAQAGRTKKDFTNFLTHALKSANETKYWLMLIDQSNKSPKPNTTVLLNEVIEIANILAASILKLTGKR